MAHSSLCVSSLWIWIFILPNSKSYCEEKTEALVQENATLTKDERLFLTPLIEQGKIKEAQEAAEVTGIPEIKSLKSYSGYLTVDKQRSTNLFFWFYPAQTDYKNAPVVLWLQGGVGWSSLRGLFLENGPYDIATGTLEKRNVSWTNQHSVIYLDVPPGAGFSRTREWGTPKMNVNILADDVYKAVLQFFKLFPDLQKNSFFVAGQAYAGKYIPVIASLIHERNPKAEVQVNLVGVAIGNGLVDPETQLRYSDFLYEVGLVNKKGKHELQKNEEKILTHIKKKAWKDAYDVFAGLILSVNNTLFKNLTGFDNFANVLEHTALSNKQLNMNKYISQPRILQAIHVGNHSFYSYFDLHHFLLSDDMMQSVAPLLSDLINNYKVLVYNGQLDVIIPYRTTVDYLRKLTFNGSEVYEDADRIHWYVKDDLAGYVAHAGNLTEILVRNAGHIVTEDQLEWATDMLYRFTRNLPFSTPENQ